MMAAITAAKNKHNVIILEKMGSIGNKLLITGKGRCNITNSADMDDFFKNIPGNSKFLYSAFNNFTNKDIVSFLESNGVETKIERGGRIFPVSDKSIDVLSAFKKKLKELNVEIAYNSRVKEIKVENGKAIGAILESGKEILGDKIILATGGKSYPITGSTGDGYEIAKKIGHTTTKIMPALVPLTCTSDSLSMCRDLQGLSLKNVSLKIECDKKVIFEEFGEMLFTHFGISGPIVLSASSLLIRKKDIEDLLKGSKIKAHIDLKPALSEEKLDDRILRDFASSQNKAFKNSLNKLLPQKMIEPVIALSEINPEKRVNEITKEERKRLVRILKNMEFVIGGFRPIEEAIITAGGVNTKEINPKTMESKIVKNLYFAGEVIDVDALTGGFNLQIAYSTGFTAGKLG